MLNPESKPIEDFDQNLNAEQKLLMKNLKIQRHDLYFLELNSFSGALVDFINHLRKKYPDYQKYRLYHLIASSTLFEECPYFDFPDDDSIEKFLHDKYQELPRHRKEEKFE
jgi:hypothetical protein